jgi:hypothetical protein
MNTYTILHKSLKAAYRHPALISENFVLLNE